MSSHSTGTGSKTLSYDAAGNIRAIGSALYDYDAIQRLVAANDDAFHLYWSYDANGNRLEFRGQYTYFATLTAVLAQMRAAPPTPLFGDRNTPSPRWGSTSSPSRC